MSPTTKLLCDLIAIPSINPAFVPPDDSRAGERRVADFLAFTADRVGLEIEFQEVLPGRSNFFARLTPSGPIRRRILLAPHLDVVPGTDAQFQPRQKNGRIYGRGACDTKGCVAAMLTAVMNVALGKQRPRESEIIFVGLIDEENNQSGSRALAAKHFRADFAIVGEPTRLQVVTAHKGDLWLKLETHGRSAHGATPQLGRNAVHAMARVVDVLETEYAASLRRKKNHLLGCATVNVGSISGGRQPNIVPDHCWISVDRRTIPGETEKQVRGELSSLLRKHGLKVTMSDTRGATCQPMETDVRLPLVQQFMASVGRRKALGVDYFCDASILSAGGIPSIVFGPGDIAQAHTADEWISISSLERGARMLTRFLQSLP